MASGRGHGCSLGLARKEFLDELVSRVNYSTGVRNQGPSYVRRIPLSLRMEASISTVERTVGFATPSGIPVEGNIGDRGIYVGLGV